jgi:hypothetical protein
VSKLSREQAAALAAQGKAYVVLSALKDEAKTKVYTMSWTPTKKSTVVPTSKPLEILGIMKGNNIGLHENHLYIPKDVEIPEIANYREKHKVKGIGLSIPCSLILDTIKKKKLQVEIVPNGLRNRDPNPQFVLTFNGIAEKGSSSGLSDFGNLVE